YHKCDLTTADVRQAHATGIAKMSIGASKLWATRMVWRRKYRANLKVPEAQVGESKPRTGRWRMGTPAARISAWRIPSGRKQPTWGSNRPRSRPFAILVRSASPAPDAS